MVVAGIACAVVVVVNTGGGGVVSSCDGKRGAVSVTVTFVEVTVTGSVFISVLIDVASWLAKFVGLVVTGEVVASVDGIVMSIFQSTMYEAASNLLAVVFSVTLFTKILQKPHTAGSVYREVQVAHFEAFATARINAVLLKGSTAEATGTCMTDANFT